MVMALVLLESDSATGLVAACTVAAVVEVETDAAVVPVVGESSVDRSVSSSFCLVPVCFGEDDSILKKGAVGTSWDV